MLNCDYPSGKAPPVGQLFIARRLKLDPNYHRIKQKSQEANLIAANLLRVCTVYFRALSKVILE